MSLAIKDLILKTFWAAFLRPQDLGVSDVGRSVFSGMGFGTLIYLSERDWPLFL